LTCLYQKKIALLAIFNFQSSSSKFLVTLSSRIITVLSGVIFVPIYVRMIGVESYGLVAFYGTLAGALIIFDLGLSTAISRQVAILKSQGGRANNIQDLVLSVELIYWIIAVGIGLLIILLSYPIAIYWLKAKDLPSYVIRNAIILMGIVFAFQFPASIYDGVMIGLEKQSFNALLYAALSVMKAIGVIAALYFISPTVQCYFIWQALVTLVFTLLSRYLAKRFLPSSETKARFSKTQLKTIWRFAAGMAGISFITFFLSQIDKIVVSKLVRLDYVGYYNLAFIVAGAIIQAISPLQPVIFPKFSALAAQNKQQELIALYHKGCRWVAIIVFPIGFTLIFFAKEILLLWTKNLVLAENTAPILKVFAVGSMCNCMMWMPYFFMLAKGNTRYTIYQNTIASIILVPLLFWWATKYGALGASYVWLSVNAGYVLISIPIFHRLYMKQELGNWYKDISLPLISSVALAMIAKYCQIKFAPNPTLFYLALVIIFMYFIYACITPEIRKYATKLKLKMNGEIPFY
jgi:O-antigen/teichoic acid export membrane protein